MYFQIENTPEHIRRARRNTDTKQQTSPEVTPQLVVAPFSKPPQVVFQNVPIGVPCKRSLEIYNPTKQTQQLKLSKALPPDLNINLPGETLDLEPDDCYSLSLIWTPTQPTALRETIRFTNEHRGRFDVILVLKSVVNGQNSKKKPLKVSPGKIQKRTVKKSPTFYKTNVVYDTTTIKKTVTVLKTNVRQIYSQYEKENVPENMSYLHESKSDKNPFGSPVNFDTSEIFSNLRKTNIDNAFQQTYNNNEESEINPLLNTNLRNVMTPSNKQHDISNSDIFDKVSFTPLKCISNKLDHLRVPRLVISREELDSDEDTENLCKPDDTQSIMSVMSKGTDRWLVSEQDKAQNDCFLVPRSEPIDKQIPNTSSPKDTNGPDFSINTDFSRISDVSFLPPRCSTEKKIKIHDTRDILDDANLNCDTFTKESSFNYPSMNYNINLQLPTNLDPKPLNTGAKICRNNLMDLYEHNKELDYWPQSVRPELKSPAPTHVFEAPSPLQCIMEESTQLSETQVLNKTDKHTDTFTIDRTFDTTSEFTPKIRSTQNTWSKRDVRADHALWKVPVTTVKKSKKTVLNSSASKKVINTTYDGNNSTIRNSSFYQPGNVYSQSLTVDPFLSTTYYYDEEAVKNFEIEFKRWLNCILTPPADLDSNIEQKIDVGKAWIENRNKEIPLAPTKEKVCSAYHNNHRLESLRRSAKVLLFNQDVSNVILKLNAQIEKKLIAIRTDRNLHLDVGLQKAIMEIILCYNPLWLRIGLEAIYNTVIPLKSNSDIEGLTIFIIQRMFKNPFLKNKHSKSSAPNILLPAYVEAIKKFTLKKFFMLVFFLDQAKQKKLIAHDPCLFCRSAPYKESREIIIRFTRELIAGIGDITKHLRPLGYVVTHKQTSLDEYKYAVNNIAVDIRDGVRLTRVMEIILIKNDLLKQLRTPAVSRLQKIHNVQVALNALKEANFTIVGDITATDIADGHREKTLSLLWQIIHVFRAPLFEKAANVIQTWWKKKYQAILDKKYAKMKTAVVVVQAFCRMWLQRKRFIAMKQNVLKIEDWYVRAKKMREAKDILKTLKAEREVLRNKAAIKIQSHVRKLIYMRLYSEYKRRTILIQSLIRCYLQRKKYLALRNAVILIQNAYRNRNIMKKDMQAFKEKKNSAIKIQSFYRMIKQRRHYLELKFAVKLIEERYVALQKMRENRSEFIKLKQTAIKIQAHYRGKKQRQTYMKLKQSVLKIEDWYLMKKDRESYKQKRQSITKIQNYYRMFVQRRKYLRIKQAVLTIEERYKAVITMRRVRTEYRKIRQKIVKIQAIYRGKQQRKVYEKLRQSAMIIQDWFRRIQLMKQAKIKLTVLKTERDLLRCRSAVIIQRYIVKWLCMIKYREIIKKTVLIQSLIRAYLVRKKFIELKAKTVFIQNKFRGKLAMRKERAVYLRTRTAVIKIQSYFRMVQQRREYNKLKQAVRVIEERYIALTRMRKARNEYLTLKTKAVLIQSHYRGFKQRKIYLKHKETLKLIELNAKTEFIQNKYRAKLAMRKERAVYLRTRNAIIKIQSYYRMVQQRREYNTLKQAVRVIEERYKALIKMRKTKNEFLTLKTKAIIIQSNYRGFKQRKNYLQQKEAVIKIQQRLRATIAMKIERKSYQNLKQCAITIQTRFRAYLEMKKQRHHFLILRLSAIQIQRNLRTYLAIKNFRLQIKNAIRLKKQENAAICIQKHYRRYVVQSKYKELRVQVIKIQRIWRGKLVTRLFRCEFEQKRRAMVLLQAAIRGYLLRKRLKADKERMQKEREELMKNVAVVKIQAYYRGFQIRKHREGKLVEIARRCREKIQHSHQHTLRQRYDRLIAMLSNAYLIGDTILMLTELEYLTDIYPMFFPDTAAMTVHFVFPFLLATNRSISSVKVLNYAYAAFINLTRYNATGPKVYDREFIEPTLKFMLRFCNSEPTLFCRMCTFIWLFTKYAGAREDLELYLKHPENMKLLNATKIAVEKANKKSICLPKYTMTPARQHKSIKKDDMPSLEPLFRGSVKKLAYFSNPHQAIFAIYDAYDLRDGLFENSLNQR